MARYVLAVVDERHFGRAAARLHVSQSALSAQVKQLEDRLGVRFFDRSTRRVEVTPAGERFAVLARSLVAAADRVGAEMDLLAQGLAGRVSVGFVGTATYDVLPRLTRLVAEQLPGVDLRLRGEMLSPQLADGVADGTFDLALLRPPLARRDVDVEVVREERLVAVLPVSHPLADADRVDLADLADLALVTHPAEGSSMNRRVLDACERAGFTPPSVLEVGETATLVVFVAAGLGIGLVPHPVRALGLDGVAYVPLARPEVVSLAVATRPGEPSAAVRRVRELVGLAAAGP